MLADSHIWEQRTTNTATHQKYEKLWCCPHLFVIFLVGSRICCCWGFLSFLFQSWSTNTTVFLCLLSAERKLSTVWVLPKMMHDQNWVLHTLMGIYWNSAVWILWLVLSKLIFDWCMLTMHIKCHEMCVYVCLIVLEWSTCVPINLTPVCFHKRYMECVCIID